MVIKNRQTEKRIWKDSHGLYHLQIRYIPVYSWEDDGWKTIYASDSYISVAERFYGKEYYGGVY